jgi:hypothetical protein
MTVLGHAMDFTVRIYDLILRSIATAMRLEG